MPLSNKGRNLIKPLFPQNKPQWGKFFPFKWKKERQKNPNPKKGKK